MSLKDNISVHVSDIKKFDVINNNSHRFAFEQLIIEKYIIIGGGNGTDILVTTTIKGSDYVRNYGSLNISSTYNRFRLYAFFPMLAVTIYLAYLTKKESQDKQAQGAEIEPPINQQQSVHYKPSKKSLDNSDSVTISK